MLKRLLLLTLAAVLCAHGVSAQTLTPTLQSAPSIFDPVGPPDDLLGKYAALGADDEQTTVVAKSGEKRACDGCPRRRIGTSFLQVTYVNGIYELANLIRGQDTAHITPKTWWTNMKRGWEWDLDEFVVNQFGHPYQGNNYYTTGRANGLSFWESAALTAFGSGTWEFFGETNQASLNDFINTTMGGIALGEMLHRTAWLILDPTATGGSRKKKEIFATAIDPMNGINRFISGDAHRVSEKPAEFTPSSLAATTAAGVLWRGSNTEDVESAAYPSVQVDLLYGDPTTGRSRTPYDAFGVRFDFGGGTAISEIRVRGRLLGQPYKDGALQLMVAQGYQFNKNPAYWFGAESVETSVSTTRQLSPTFSFWTGVWGGVTILGAVDSVPPPGVDSPVPEPGEDAGQGVSTGPRFYDYGPGTNFGGIFNLRHRSMDLITFSYEAHQLHVLDGVRCNHFLQRAGAYLDVPVKGRLGIGAAGEFFDRRTFYQTPGVPRAHFHFPQFRAFLTWSSAS